MSKARVVTLSNRAGLAVSVMDWGATWLSCTLPMPGGAPREIILGCANLKAYQEQNYYLGATIGRYANRIRNAQFEQRGGTCALSANEGVNQLHGGPVGFDRRLWAMTQVSQSCVQLELVSADGDQGFPGELDARVSYTLGEDLSLRIDWEATCDKASPVCLTNHAYFNLDGDQGARTPSVLAHQLRLQAGYWLPVDEACLPSGPLRRVDQTGFDLREARQLQDAIDTDQTLRASNGFDHAFALYPQRQQSDCLAAELTASDQRVKMQLLTDQSALQVYTGNGLAGTKARDGGVYSEHAGIALEPEYLPDSPNHPVSEPYWPSCTLQAGARWHRFMECRWEVG